RLHEEAAVPALARDGRAAEELDRDARVEREVPGAPHLAHAAAPEQSLDRVPLADETIATPARRAGRARLPHAVPRPRHRRKSVAENVEQPAGTGARAAP